CGRGAGPDARGCSEGRCRGGGTARAPRGRPDPAPLPPGPRPGRGATTTPQHERFRRGTGSFRQGIRVRRAADGRLQEQEVDGPVSPLPAPPAAATPFVCRAGANLPKECDGVRERAVPGRSRRPESTECIRVHTSVRHITP